MVCGGTVRSGWKPFGQIKRKISLTAGMMLTVVFCAGAVSCGERTYCVEQAANNTAQFLKEELPGYEERYAGVVLGSPHVYMGLADITQDEIPEIFIGAEDNVGHIWFTAYSWDLQPLNFGFDHETSEELFRSRRYQDKSGQSYFLAETYPKSAAAPNYSITKIWNDGQIWQTETRQAAQTDPGNSDEYFACAAYVAEINEDTLERDVISGFETYFRLNETTAEK